MKITDYSITKEVVQLLNDPDEICVSNGVLIEGNGLCTIYDKREENFCFVCTSRFELDTILETQYLKIKVLLENEIRRCSGCGNLMNEGFYFESDGTQYCSRDCLEKVIKIKWEEYSAIYDEGNGDAYWTSWERI